MRILLFCTLPPAADSPLYCSKSARRVQGAHRRKTAGGGPEKRPAPRRESRPRPPAPAAPFLPFGPCGL